MVSSLQYQVSVYGSASWNIYKQPGTGRMSVFLWCSPKSCPTVITYCPRVTQGLGLKTGWNNEGHTVHSVQLGGRTGVLVIAASLQGSTFSFFFFFDRSSDSLSLLSCCVGTGGDPNKSGTNLQLQPWSAQPAGPLRCAAEQITGGKSLRFPQRV